MTSSLTTILALIALMLLAPYAEAQTERCVAEKAAFEQGMAAYNHRVLTDEAFLEIIRAYRDCPGLADDRVATATRWKVFVLVPGHLSNEPGARERALRALAVLDEYREWLGENEPPGWYYNDRGRALVDAGRDFEAAEMLRRALETDLTDSIRISVLRRVGLAFRQIGDLDSAARSFEDAISLARQSGDKEQEIYARMRLGEVLSSASRRAGKLDRDLLLRATVEMEAADRALARPDSISRRNEETRRRMRASGLTSLAGMRELLGQPGEALETARLAIELAEGFPQVHNRALLFYGSALRAAGQNERSLEVLEQASRNSEADDATVLYQLAQTYQKLRRSQEAEVHFRRATELYSELGEGQGASSAASALFNWSQGTYRAYVSFLLQEGRYQEAFVRLDDTRVRSLRDLRRVAAAGAHQRATAGELARLEEERRRLRAIIASGGDDANVRAALASVEAQLGGIGIGKTSSESFSLEQLQRDLARDDRIMLSYFIDEPVHAFVISADTFAAVPLAIAPEALWEMVEAVRFRPDGTRWRTDVESADLHALYQAVFAPVAHLIPEGRPVTVVADGPLAQVPFGMLVSDVGPRFRYSEWPFLIRRNAFSTELAAGVFLQGAASAASHPLLAFGRTAFSSVDVLPRSERGRPPSPLPAVGNELRALQRHVPHGIFALDASARRGDFLDLMGDARVVHLASHVYVSEDPLYTALLLYPKDDYDKGSGALYMFDLIGRQLASDLVVLSACASAQGTMYRGEGIVGLHYAFRAAGSAASMATLWPVDDDATAYLMDRFYRHLRVGMPKDVALQQAQLDALSSRRGLAASPFFWSSFVLAGNPDPIDLRQPGPSDRLWVLLGLSLLAGSLLAGHHYRRPRNAP